MRPKHRCVTKLVTMPASALLPSRVSLEPASCHVKGHFTIHPEVPLAKSRVKVKECTSLGKLLACTVVSGDPKPSLVTVQPLSGPDSRRFGDKY